MKEPDLISIGELRKITGKKSKKEEKIQLQVCEYIKNTYPDVIFTCDLASGMKLPIWMGALHKRMRSSRGLPDLFIAQSKSIKTGTFNMMGDEFVSDVFNGLFIEIKRAEVRLKNGSIQKTEHHTEQAEILYRLSKSGYKAVFGCGFDECKEIIDEYLKK